MSVDGTRVLALVDSGCSLCICHESVCRQWQRRNIYLKAINGQMMRCAGEGTVRIRVPEVTEVEVRALIVKGKPLGFNFILGMNAVTAMGGVQIISSDSVRFGPAAVVDDAVGAAVSDETSSDFVGRFESAAVVGDTNLLSVGATASEEKRSESEQEKGQSEPAARKEVAAPSGVMPGAIHERTAYSPESLCIEEKDYKIVFDSDTKTWMVEWKWAERGEPDTLKNRVASYTVLENRRAEYEEELQRWVDEGWLIPYDQTEQGQPEGLIPLMAVLQERKKKVRPVLDYRELNEHLDTHTADADVCTDKMRQWRKMGVNVAAVDLKSAYLQIHVHPSLWKYQTVIFRGKRWALSRLGFGMNISPSVMKSVLSTVLSLDPVVKEGTSSYVDDILVNEDVVSADSVREHLAQFGLVAKEPERARDGAKLLGLSVHGEGGKLQWTRGDDSHDVPDKLTRRSVFSLCGKLVGHFPVCSWLRPAVAFIKRRANAVTESWDDQVCCEHVRNFLVEVTERVRQSDPVRGRWDVCGDDEAHLWVDASSVAIGVALEVGGSVIEDGAWLRTSDVTHINMAELDAVVKGLNLALTWGFQKIILYTDSATVHRWISDGLTGKTRLRTKAASEMLIRRRVEIVTSLVKEYQLQLSVELVQSEANKADVLTRVPHRWLRALAEGEDEVLPACGLAVETGTDATGYLVARVHHEWGHPGIRRTHYFARLENSNVTRKEVQKVVADCQICRSIDPAPVKWRSGKLEVDTTWSRLAIDVTHVHGRPYLTAVDCGPSRFAIWQPLRAETAEVIAEQLDVLFVDRGPPAEVLVDNATAFRSRCFAQFALQWGVTVRYRCAYVPSGNGIVERNHRTVKVIAARKGCSVLEAVHIYNATPRHLNDAQSTPTSILNSCVQRNVGMVAPRTPNTAESPYEVGECVWVKPPQVRCDTRYEQGVVTTIISEQAVEVDGIPRHIRDLRPRVEEGAPGNLQNTSQVTARHEQDSIEDEESLVLRFGCPGQADDCVAGEPAGDGVQGGQPLRRSARLRRQPQRLMYS